MQLEKHKNAVKLTHCLYSERGQYKTSLQQAHAWIKLFGTFRNSSSLCFEKSLL